MDQTFVSEPPVQKYLGPKFLIAFITLMNMFVPLSTDLYLPALPSMSSQFNSPPALTNLTLSVFFFFYALGVLLWGPLSDKYGRRPILMLATSLYIFSSGGCALSMSAYSLILFRLIQGIGAGGITSVSMAIIKDCYRGKLRETVLAITQAMVGIAPMVAPILGAWLLSFSTWRMSFVVLGAFGAISLVLTVLYTESHPRANRYQGSLLGGFGRLLVVGRNKSFMLPAVIFSLSTLPFMGYISLSSYIYIDYFNLSEQHYSYYFATNALLTAMAPILYIRFFTGFNKQRFAVGCFLVATLSGILVMTIGTMSPLLFMLSFLLLSMIVALLRPFSTNIVMDQHDGDTGSVASIWNTLNMVLGSFGMILASLPLGNIVMVLGAMIALFPFLSLLSWMAFMKSGIPCVGVKDSQNETFSQAEYALD